MQFEETNDMIFDLMEENQEIAEYYEDKSCEKFKQEIYDLQAKINDIVFDDQNANPEI